MDDTPEPGVALLLAGLLREARPIDDDALDGALGVVRNNLRVGDRRLKTLPQKQAALEGVCSFPGLTPEQVQALAPVVELFSARALLANPDVGARERAGVLLAFQVRHPRQLLKLVEDDPVGQALTPYVGVLVGKSGLFARTYARLAGMSAEELEIAVTLLAESGDDPGARLGRIRRRVADVLDAAERLAEG